MKLFYRLLLCTVLTAGPAIAAGGEEVETVLVIFKTHLDIGFTDLSSAVEKRYIDEFIPKAIDTAEELREENGEARYVWTTGAWLIDTYLKSADPEAASELVEAIGRGDIVWNGVPYTVESESLNKEMFSELLRLSASLDGKFGKKTTAAKMTDVPGHTRSIVPLLYDAGIKFLHIGSNSAAAIPEIPPVCRWKDPVSGKQIILMYQSGYGQDMVLPDGKTAVSINFTGDNHGPHSAGNVRGIFARLAERYPGAEIKAASLNEVEAALTAMSDRLPIITDEIGDTWIYGYGSSPMRMKKFRELSRLFASWLDEGKIKADSPEATGFAVRLGMIAEHTWGLDVKSHLRHWETYGYDDFTAARDLPEFKKMEASWKELDDNIEKAVALLPEELAEEARDALATAERTVFLQTGGGQGKPMTDSLGRYRIEYKGLECLAGELAYRSYSDSDYRQFMDNYLISRDWWAIEDNSKPGLENSPARSAEVTARLTGTSAKGKGSFVCDLEFPEDSRIDSRVYPEKIQTSYKISKRGKVIDMTVSIGGKPANRMPESYWLTFRPENLVGVIAEKTGEPVDLLDVVAGGNRQMHGIDRYVDLVTTGGTIRIWSPDALLLTLGERNGLGFSKEMPDLSEGIHFCLFNNLWGTNFSMWWEGSITYRFRIEIL